MGVIYSGPALHPEEDIVSKPFIAQEQRLTLVDKLLELYKKFTYLFYEYLFEMCKFLPVMFSEFVFFAF